VPESDPTDVPAAVPAEQLDRLYGLPLDEFTPARDALAKELRQAGQRSEADWIKRLRKPSPPAWVVNQLARTQRDEADELQAAGEALRKAQEALLEGRGTGDELSQAASRQREAVARLIEKAECLLDRGGQPPSRATLEKAHETLEAVALDGEAQKAFALGRMNRETRPVGLGLLGGAPIASLAKKRSGEGDRRKRGEDTRAKEHAERQKDRAELENEERTERQKGLQAAKEEERRRRRELGRAEQEAEEARREAERAQTRLAGVETQLEGARSAYEEARDRLDKAHRVKG
jgi:hypothetical protein